jgi:hypothetical protein
VHGKRAIEMVATLVRDWRRIQLLFIDPVEAAKLVASELPPRAGPRIA